MKDYTYKIDNQNPEEKKRFVRKLFDSIVPTYDLLNHVLSMGTDILWRGNIFRHIQDVGNKKALDLCCGTGDLSLVLHRKGAETVSLDFSMNMLKRGLEKKAIKGFPVAADASRIPHKDNTFSVATIAFGIRNIPDIDNFIMEVFRVLKPGGELAILELVRPKNRLILFLYSIYLGKVLPFVGGIISGKRTAYQYLATTIETFIDPSGIKAMLENYGFKNVSIFPQTFGVAAIIVGRKERE